MSRRLLSKPASAVSTKLANPPEQLTDVVESFLDSLEEDTDPDAGFSEEQEAIDAASQELQVKSTVLSFVKKIRPLLLDGHGLPFKTSSPNSLRGVELVKKTMEQEKKATTSNALPDSSISHGKGTDVSDACGQGLPPIKIKRTSDQSALFLTAKRRKTDSGGHDPRATRMQHGADDAGWEDGYNRDNGWSRDHRHGDPRRTRSTDIGWQPFKQASDGSRSLLHGYQARWSSQALPLRPHPGHSPAAASSSVLAPPARVRSVSDLDQSRARKEIWNRHHVPCRRCRELGVTCKYRDSRNRCFRCVQDEVLDPKCHQTFWLDPRRVRKWIQAIREGKSKLEADRLAYGDNTEMFGVAEHNKITDYSSLMPTSR
ncbi:hypothetical protein sr10691.2 [Sporisorium reilianum SRZ2]|uniref:Uncharacterized protein n=1 Tax=Sporisorium reilianum (strain SRZ2) TaxID=999809 RepID=E6ZY73_SPORE|nr:hypothetical protein sr10691.2 [Sporisorium reilianum SRZ2]